MAFDGVPWAITGSQLDTFVMREFAGIATRFSQGIALPSDLKVTAAGGNSLNCNIAGGGATIRNAQAAGQSYVGYAGSSTSVSHAATGGAGRSDLIIARVRDPDFSPWTAYTDPNQILHGPYYEPFVVPGVPSNTTLASQVVSYSAIALARVDLTAGLDGVTAGITSGMIHDLRALSAARTAVARTLVYTGITELLAVTDTSFKTFPTGSLVVTVPDWATHCLASIRLNQLQVDNNPSDMQSRVKFDNGAGTTVFGNGCNWDYNGAAGNNFAGAAALPFEIFADVNVTSLQGQSVTVSPQAFRTFTSNTGVLGFNPNQQVIFDLMFVERTL